MTERNLGIDLLRVMSITLVVLSHYELLHGFFLNGTHGVVLFFMVSGFCMAYSTEGRTGRAFLTARFWRLIPTLVVCATLTTGIELFWPGIRPDRLHGLKDYVLNLACLSSGNLLCDAASDLIRGRPIWYLWVDGAYWSLLVEIRFYALLWLLFYIMRLRRVSFFIAALGLLAPFNLPLEGLSKGQDFFLYLAFFAFGLGFRAFLDKEPYAVFSLVGSFLVFCLSCLMTSAGISMALNPSNLLSYGFCFVLFIAAMLFFRRGRSRIVSYLGVLSYPLYLIHQDAGYVLKGLLERHLSSTEALIVTLIAAVLAAAGVQYLIDLSVPRLRKRGKNSFPRSSEPPADAAESYVPVRPDPSE